MLQSYKEQALADVSWLERKIGERLEWSDVKLVWAMMVFLDTQTWRLVVTAAPDLDSESENSPEDKSFTEVLAAVKLIATIF